MVRLLKNSAWIACAVLVLGIPMAKAGDLTFLKGKYGGKFTGVLLIAQAETVRLIANANFTVAATKAKASIVIKGTLNSNGYQQRIILSPNGAARVDPMIPGGTNLFNNAANGTYKQVGKTVVLTLPNPGGGKGSMTMRINFTNANSTLSITDVIKLQGSETIFGTIVGA